MQYLDEKLIEYQKSEMYPFHMPGHKRRIYTDSSPYEIDITEIEGFDNLHHAESILKEAQQRAADLYGAEQSFYLVNGSTCGLLAAICGVTQRGDRILIARNSHKAVYHGLFLNELQAEYVFPDVTSMGIQGQIHPRQIQEALKKHADICAVVITSPTYEGVISDIKGIAKIVHAAGIPLIVDEAHGAHLGLETGFPENAVKQGADLVIMSLHKTLPSLTQTALLHICSERVDKEKIKRYLDIFQTSSPSYVLMGGMDACIRMIQTEGKELFRTYRKRLNFFYQETENLKYLQVIRKKDFLPDEVFDWDDSKIVIFSRCGDVFGNELYQQLLYKYQIQMEMKAGYYVLGMTSIMDSQEGFDRLAKALKEMDALLEGKYQFQKPKEFKAASNYMRVLYKENPQQMTISQALGADGTEVSFAQAAGEVAADFVYLYPPGIPMIAPGEQIRQEFLESLQESAALGISVEGGVDMESGRIRIVNSNRVSYTKKVEKNG